jgi:hypothetical protein
MERKAALRLAAASEVDLDDGADRRALQLARAE